MIFSPTVLPLYPWCQGTKDTNNGYINVITINQTTFVQHCYCSFSSTFRVIGRVKREDSTKECRS